jgi:hypothetical protein
MRLRTCGVITASVILVLIVGFVVTCFVVLNWVDPYYHGKRVYEWADIAIWDPDAARRREAADVLVEAFPDLSPTWARVSLIQRSCQATDDGKVLPREVLPFLLETLHASEMSPGGYQSWAISRVEPEAAIPALIDVMLHDNDENACESASQALSRMGQKAVPALHQALTDAPEDKRGRIRKTLEQIERAEKG